MVLRNLDDTAALIECALVSTTFGVCAQKLLFERVTIKDESFDEKEAIPEDELNLGDGPGHGDPNYSTYSTLLTLRRAH